MKLLNQWCLKSIRCVHITSISYLNKISSYSPTANRLFLATIVHLYTWLSNCYICLKISLAVALTFSTLIRQTNLPQNGKFFISRCHFYVTSPILCIFWHGLYFYLPTIYLSWPILLVHDTTDGYIRHFSYKSLFSSFVEGLIKNVILNFFYKSLYYVKRVRIRSFIENHSQDHEKFSMLCRKSLPRSWETFVSHVYGTSLCKY